MCTSPPPEFVRGFATRHVIEYINSVHGTTFRMLGRFAVGENGAYRMEDASGEQFVLKWAPRPAHLSLIHAAATVTEELRALGYPTPKYVLTGAVPGGCFGVQGALRGSPRRELTLDMVRQLVILNDLQAGRGAWLAAAFPQRPDWDEEAIRAVTDGYATHNCCDVELLHAYSRSTSDLLRVLREFVESADPARTMRDDIVHFDFSPANVLVDGEQVAGVVDWEGVRAGDRVFDLATLLFYSTPFAAIRDHLWHVALDRSRPGKLGVYLAHMIVRQVDFSIRYHDAAAVEQWLAYARNLMGMMERL